MTGNSENDVTAITEFLEWAIFRVAKKSFGLNRI